MSNKEKLANNSMLFTTAFLWGSSYAVRKMALLYIGAFFFNGVRFFLGFFVIFIAYIIMDVIHKKSKTAEAPISAETRYKPIKWQITGGILTGIFYGMAANFQQIGLLTSDAGKCGFISSFYIFFIPLISWAVLRKKVAAKIWFGAGLAVTGLFFISAGSSFQIIAGDVMFLLAAISFAVQITLIGHYVTHANPLLLVSIQLLTCSAISMMLSVFFESGYTASSLIAAMFPIIYTGVLSIGFANLLQFIAQKKATPSVAGIILSLESVFGAIFAAIIIHERMNMPQILGCGLIFLAIVISQIERTRNHV